MSSLPATIQATTPRETDLRAEFELKRCAGLSKLALRREYVDGTQSLQPVVSLRRDDASLIAARRIVNDLLAPAPWDTCMALARRLHALCVLPRDAASAPEDLAVVYDSRAEVLSEHAEDIARHAVETWARSNKFYPTVAELRDHCNTLSRPRRLLTSAVNEAIRRAERGEPDPGERPANPELRAKLGAELEALAKAMRAKAEAFHEKDDAEARARRAARLERAHAEHAARTSSAPLLPGAPRDGRGFRVRVEYGQARKEFRACFDETETLVYLEDNPLGRAGDPVELRPDLLTWREL